MSKELFEEYLNAPFSELAKNDEGRNDARRLCFEDFDIPLELIRHVWNAGRASAQSSQQGAVACWAAYNGVCLEAFFKTKEKADEYAAEMQKNHDLSGLLAAFHVKPLYTHPHATESDRRDAERYRWMRDFNVRCKDGVEIKTPCEHVFASIYAHEVGTIPATRLVTGEELDRAIDSALSQMQEPGGEG